MTRTTPPAVRPRFAWSWPSILDRYLLRELLPTLLLCLGTVLVALLLERLLRLFNILAQNNQALPAVARLVLDLVPHYLGLALPAAFFAALFMVVAKLGDDNELDAYLAGGQSIARLTRPFLAVSILLAGFSYALFGYIQPYARYQYHAVMYAALNAGWDARLQAGTFANAGSDYTLTADEVDITGRGLTRVLVRRVVNGREEITVGERGELTPIDNGTRLKLELWNGNHVRDRPEGELLKVEFARLDTNTAFSPDAPAYRARGNSERELTFDELRQGGIPGGASASLTPSKLAGEFNGRLARTLSLPLLPLLAVPLGMSAKRGKRTASLVVAAVVLLLFHHALQLGESLTESGKAAAWIGVWAPWTVFAAFCIWLFSQSLARPGDNPVTRLVLRIEGLFGGIAQRFRRKPAKPGR